MLSAQNIYKHFGGVIALEDANLDIGFGEVRALVGGNGSGKSTLSKIMAGSYRPDSGKILIDGKIANIHSPKDAQKYGIINTFQELSLFPNLTVGQNLLIGSLPRVAGIFTDNKAIRRQAKQMLERFKLDQYVDHLVADIPLDDKYMVEFAKAVIQQPKYLIIDEVASALRREQVQQITDMINELASKECAVLYITHRLHEVYSICKSITVMRSGKVLLTAPLSDLKTEEIISYMSPEKKKSGSKTKDIPVSAVRTSPLPAEGQPAELLLEVESLTLPGCKAPVNIKLYKGEILGIAGLQGQGQSQLIRSLFGVLPGVTPKVKICEKIVSVNSPEIAIKCGIGFISGDREKEGTFPIRSVKENMLSVPEKYYGEPVKKGSLKPEAVITKLGVVLDNLRQSIKFLSGGNQQKIIIGRWMRLSPKILLCDDPTKGVDINAREEVHEIFKEMTKSGAGVIVSSSDDHELIDLADRILVMYGGLVVKELVGVEKTEDNIINASFPSQVRSH